MLNIGHRGAMGHVAENTLASFQAALDFGVDWLELDVYFVDGELVVIHDDTLERTTNGSGEVMAQSLEQLRSLDAGGGEKIPLLSEVFALVDKRVGINVELKGPNTAVPTIQFLEAQLKAGWQADQLLLSSFNHQELLIAKQTNSLFSRAPLYWMGEIEYDFVLNELGAIAVNPSLRMVTAELVQQAHQHDLKVFVYTVNETADLQRMLDWGVDGVFTNYPDRLNALLAYETTLFINETDGDERRLGVAGSNTDYLLWQWSVKNPENIYFEYYDQRNRGFNIVKEIHLDMDGCHIALKNGEMAHFYWNPPRHPELQAFANELKMLYQNSSILALMDI